MTAHRERMIDAITSAAEISGDEEVASDSAQVYRDVEDELALLLKRDDQPNLAFLSFVPVGARNQMALTVLLQDRLLVAWKQGLLRKKTGSLVVPYSKVRQVTAQRVATDVTLGRNPTVTVEADKSYVIAVPPEGSPLAEAVREAIASATGSQ